MATVSAVFAMIFMLFFDSILTMYLISELKIGENSAGILILLLQLYRVLLCFDMRHICIVFSFYWHSYSIRPSSMAYIHIIHYRIICSSHARPF